MTISNQEGQSHVDVLNLMVEIFARLMAVLEDIFFSPIYDKFLNSSSGLVDGKTLPLNATVSSNTRNE